MSVIERAGVCTFDCPDTCSLSVTVEDGRITKVRGSEAAPFTAGVICNKVARDMTAFVHGPQRILHPLRRVGPKGSGAFERITWDAALDEIHARTSDVIQRWGPSAVTPLNYAGPHGMLAGDSMSSRFFYKLGATQLYRRSMCGGVRSEAWSGTYGAVPGCPPELAADAKLNVVWGNNATVTNLHLVRRIRQSKRKGGKLVVVDPLRTKIAEQADLHLAPLPGTDVLLAWALAAELERMGAFDAAFIAANLLGLRGVHGDGARLAGGARGGGVRAARGADRRVCTVAGRGRSIGVRAGQWVGARAEWRQLDPCADHVAGAAGEVGQGQRHRTRRQQRVSQDAGAAATAGPRAAGHAHAEPARCRAAFGGGRHRSTAARGVHLQPQSLVVHPDQNRMRRGLARDDVFAVGIDVAMTESMAYCDIVLPAATHFEYADLYAVVWPSLAATRRGGDPAGGRVAAEHRDLPATGGAVRVRRCRASRRRMRN